MAETVPKNFIKIKIIDKDIDAVLIHPETKFSSTLFFSGEGLIYKFHIIIVIMIMRFIK